MQRGVVLVCCAACGRLGFDPSATGDAPLDGAVSIDWSAWSAPVQITSAASPAYDWEPGLHPGGMLLVFTRTSSSFTTSDLFAQTRTNTGDFGIPFQLGFSQGGESGPAWSPDGSELYFASSRNGGAPRLFKADFDGVSFGVPVMVPELAGENLIGPTISRDGLELFYSDDDPDDNKLRRAHRASLGAPWQLDGIVTELDSPRTDGWPCLTPDGLTLLFESGRDNLEGYIYFATRPAVGAPFGTPVKVDALSDGTSSGDPELSPDGTLVVFGAERPGGAGLQDLYLATRQ